MPAKLDCVVVGAGVVGLAVARSLAIDGREVVVLEAESRMGMHSSSRNSEVIHAGIYYSRGSLKACLCVQGKALLYRYCEERGIGHSRIGKLIVACNASERGELQRIRSMARANGVEDLEYLDGVDVRSLEALVDCHGALLSPSTGIVDSHELMQALRGDIEALNGVVLLDSPVSKLGLRRDKLEFQTAGERFVCNTLVNSAGLDAQMLVAGLPIKSANVPRRYLAKGHYFAYQGRSPFSHLIYPVPEPGGLGIHATNDLAGNARFGPDVCWVDSIDYRVDPKRCEKFYAAVRSYWPGLKDDALAPAPSGRK